MSIYQSIKNVGTKALVVGGLVAMLSGCGRDVPEVERPENLLSVGQNEKGMYSLIETSFDRWDGSEYRLHVKTPEGNNFIFYDDDLNGTVDRFPSTFSKEDAQKFYNNFVPEEYRTPEQNQ
ncbi:hypothetical protein ACFLTH_12690 [Bacteroidota bacterium]